MRRAALLALIATLGTGAFSMGGVTPRVGEHGLVVFPDAGRTCPRESGKIYVGCVRQRAILEAAAARARAEHKRVLVAVGAEWCVWCHVLDRYFDGWVETTTGPADSGGRADALALSAYMSRKFVVAAVNDDAPDASESLKRIGIDDKAIDGLPAYYVVGDGRAVAIDMGPAGVAGTKTDHGFSRRRLVRQVQIALERLNTP